MLFSAELPVWFYCAQENGFLDISENSQKNTRKSTHPKEPEAISGTRGQPRGAQAPPWRGQGWGRALWPPGGLPLLWCPTDAPIYSRDAKTPEQKSFSQFSSRSRRHPLFFSGRANLEAVLASGEGRSSPSSSSSPLHPPSITSPSMCE